MNPDEKWQNCDITECQCGKTGLKHLPFDGEPKPIPSDLSFLKPGDCTKVPGQPKADGCEFDELIDFWNANIPCNTSVCTSMYTSPTAAPEIHARAETPDVDSDSYGSSYDIDPCQENPECNDMCEEYDEYNEACHKKDHRGQTSTNVHQRVINGAKYPAGSTPWLVALDWKPDNDIDLENK